MFDFLAPFANALLEFVLPGLAAAAGGYVVALLRKLLKKQNLELSAAQAARIERMVVDAILRVEEMGRRNPDMTSDEKHELGLAELASNLPDQLDGRILGRAEITALMDAALPKVRARLAGTAPIPFEPPLKKAVNRAALDEAPGNALPTPPG